ncbi:hypothetical protein FHR61_002489 [Xanthomonas arboricola]|uniref:Uncharacterized protein n=1 Tax=Xanthomonas cannabis TaxID=1885674 RepID=A0ABR6JMP2_9XANT|nr:hypothetical protein [Xanthomonas cannabis]MBB5522643.1 hypothetical protein [Xanthomonas cannabis]
MHAGQGGLAGETSAAPVAVRVPAGTAALRRSARSDGGDATRLCGLPACAPRAPRWVGRPVLRMVGAVAITRWRSLP